MLKQKLKTHQNLRSQSPNQAVDNSKKKKGIWEEDKQGQDQKQFQRRSSRAIFTAIGLAKYGQ